MPVNVRHIRSDEMKHNYILKIYRILSLPTKCVIPSTSWLVPIIFSVESMQILNSLKIAPVIDIQDVPKNRVNY